MKRIPLLVFLIAVTSLSAGCGSGPRVAVDLDRPVDPDCVVLAGDPADYDNVTLALLESVDATRAPLPVNDAERIVYRHLYECLVRVDCAGRLLPGLAHEWEREEDGRIWRFTLRPDARFWDGAHLTGEDIRLSWQRSRGLNGNVSEPWVWIDPDSIRTMGEDVLWVALKEPVEDAAALFAHPSLAVAAVNPRGVWPVGSGPYRLALQFAPADPGSGTQEMRLEPNPFSPEPLRGRSPLTLQLRPGEDPRDVLTDNVDALLVRAREDVQFVVDLPGYAATPLVWDRVYTLITPRPGSGDQGGDRDRSLRDLRRELARDVVVSDARAAESLIFGFDPNHCDLQWVEVDDASRLEDSVAAWPPRVVFDEDDADAGALAERIVALAALPEPNPDQPDEDLAAGSPLPDPLVRNSKPVARGLPYRDYQAALYRGEDLAFVTALRARVPVACLDLWVFLNSHPGLWRAVAGDGDDLEDRFEEAFLPLVGTRAHLAAREGLTHVEIDWDGVPRLHRTGWGVKEPVP